MIKLVLTQTMDSDRSVTYEVNMPDEATCTEVMENMKAALLILYSEVAISEAFKEFAED